MVKKGGKAKTGARYIEAHETAFIILIVLNVLVIFLCMVLLGVQLVKRDEKAALAELSQNQGEYIFENRPLRYQSETIQYRAVNDPITGSSLFDGTIINANEYLIINNYNQLQDFITLTNSRAVNQDQLLSGLQADEDFFTTGSVIVVATETAGLNDLSIGKIVRDENNSITIIGKKHLDQVNTDRKGVANLIKIDNIQAKTLSLDITEE